MAPGGVWVKNASFVTPTRIPSNSSRFNNTSSHGSHPSPGSCRDAAGPAIRREKMNQAAQSTQKSQNLKDDPGQPVP
jgi:hypothetical protein